MKYKFLVFVLLSTILSCTEEESVLTLASETAVVEGYIYANQPVDSIRITQAIAFSADSTLIPIDNLTVVLNDGTADIILESIGDGYYNNLNHLVQEDVNYSLSFEYKNEIVSATTYVNPTKDIQISKSTLALEKIEFTGIGPGGGPPPGGLNATPEIVDVIWDNSELSYYFIDVENIETDPEFVNGALEFFQEQGIERPERFFRSEPNIVDFYSLDSRRELQYYGTYEITVYRLNAEYAALYESVGTSTLSLREPPSNVENGLGIFTAVTPHKVLLEVVKI